MRPDRAPNAARPQQVRASADLQRQAREREISDVRKIMDTDHGRRFVWRLLELAGVYRTSFTGNSETFFREGMRNVGLVILADLHEASPDLFLTMMKECGSLAGKKSAASS